MAHHDFKDLISAVKNRLPRSTRIKDVERDVASINVSLASAADTLERVSRLIEANVAEIKDAQNKISHLQRSAASRGNVLLPGNRLLTRISLPQYFARDPLLFVNAEDKLIVPKLAMEGFYEYESSLFVARSVRPNDHVVDVGANFGYYTVLMGILVGWGGKVVAFEPHPDMNALLRENAVINWIDPQIHIIPAACADRAGNMRLFTSRARAGNTGMTAPDIGEGFGSDFEFTSFEVPSVRIDDSLDVLEGRVDFVKIDVEGGELLVLRGAQNTISANPHMKIMMEWSPGQLQANGFELSTVIAEMKSTGLSCHSLLQGNEPGSCREMSYDSLLTSGYQNIVLMRGDTFRSQA